MVRDANTLVPSRYTHLSVVLKLTLIYQQPIQELNIFKAESTHMLNKILSSNIVYSNLLRDTFVIL